MHICSFAVSVLCTSYKQRKYAFCEVAPLKLNVEKQSADCKNQAQGNGFIVLKQKPKCQISVLHKLKDMALFNYSSLLLSVTGQQDLREFRKI